MPFASSSAARSPGCKRESRARSKADRSADEVEKSFSGKLHENSTWQPRRWLNLAAIMAQFLTAVDSPPPLKQNSGCGGSEHLTQSKTTGFPDAGHEPLQRPRPFTTCPGPRMMKNRRTRALSATQNTPEEPRRSNDYGLKSAKPDLQSTFKKPGGGVVRRAPRARARAHLI